MPEWKAGQSGNPRGRPLGTSEIGRLRAALAKHVPDIIEAMVAAARSGDVGAARLVLERVVPALRSEEAPVTLEGFAGSRVELIAAVIDAIASGKLDMSRGGRLIALLNPEALEQRIERFEHMIEGEESR